MEYSLSLASDSLPDEQLHQLVRDLSRTLTQEAQVDARVVEGSGAAGAKGEPIMMAIGLAILADVSAAALLHVVRAFFERSPAINMEFRREDGVKLTIRAEHVKADQIQRTIEAAERFFGGST